MVVKRMKKKLTSRKLWIAISTILSGVLMLFGFADTSVETISGAVLVIGGSIGYIYGESKIDAARIKEVASAIIDVVETVSNEVNK